ncbi:hypothetical protein ISS98_08635 [Dyella flagellata]|uniref:Uncharacterized protein n=1 Tax=Dyella flagellata TaxID=1867833 RepID=A0ABQ5XEC9_9GAMM|nr:hypothetical protein GCM10007898_29150 [Dyella flagellata]
MAAHADPPAWVYRVDFRPPEKIFRDGFVPYGSNTDLREHEEGTSCGVGDRVATASTADSAYVSVASELERAVMFANSYGGVSDIWLYEIRATDTFYNALDTTTSGLTHADSSVRQRAFDLLNNRAGAMAIEGEYVALNGISETLIRRATRYVWQDNRYVATQEVRANPLYIDGNTRANEQPLSADTAFRRPLRLRGGIVTVGASEYGICACMARQSSPTNEWKPGARAGRTDFNSYCNPMFWDKGGASAINLHLFE